MYIPIETITIPDTPFRTKDVIFARWMGEISEIPIVHDPITKTIYSNSIWLFIHAEQVYRAGATRVDFIFNPHSENIIFHIPRSHTRPIYHYGKSTTNRNTSHDPHKAIFQQKIRSKRKREFRDAAFSSCPDPLYDWSNASYIDQTLLSIFGPDQQKTSKDPSQTIDNNPETNPAIADTRTPPQSPKTTCKSLQDHPDTDDDDPIDQTHQDNINHSTPLAGWSCRPIKSPDPQTHSRNLVSGPHSRNARSGKWQLAPLHKQSS